MGDIKRVEVGVFRATKPDVTVKQHCFAARLVRVFFAMVERVQNFV